MSAARLNKIDLHTHSVASPDGSLTEADYRRMLETERLDYIAVTDHNTIDFARELKKNLTAALTALGKRIIVGEEIRTTKGEIIGLYLKETVPMLMTPEETIAAIRQQGGLVCIPHPFENVRRGMQAASLEPIAKDVDMIEVHNGRAVFQNKSKAAYVWAERHRVAGIANSDCHATPGWGRTYTVVAGTPTRANLVQLLQTAGYRASFPGVKAVLYPKLNRLKKHYGKYHDEPVE